MTVSTVPGDSPPPDARSPTTSGDEPHNERSGLGWTALEALFSVGEVVTYVVWGMVRVIASILAALFSSN
jgi:hypothetical protein